MEDSLNSLSDEEYRALCRLALMPLKLLIPLLQVANRPEMKESIAHLPTWKQIQHCFRRFCPIKRYRSLRDIGLLRLAQGLPQKLPSDISPELLALYQTAKEREQQFSSSDFACWDEGIGNQLPFIKDDYGYINWYFFNLRDLYDPLVARGNRKRELKLINNYIAIDTLFHFYQNVRDVYTMCIAYTDEELKNMRRSHQFVLCLALGSMDANHGQQEFSPATAHLTSEELNKYFYLSHKAWFYPRKILPYSKEKEMPIYRNTSDKYPSPVNFGIIQSKNARIQRNFWAFQEQLRSQYSNHLNP